MDNLSSLHFFILCQDAFLRADMTFPLPQQKRIILTGTTTSLLYLCSDLIFFDLLQNGINFFPQKENCGYLNWAWAHFSTVTVILGGLWGVNCTFKNKHPKGRKFFCFEEESKATEGHEYSLLFWIQKWYVWSLTCFSLRKNAINYLVCLPLWSVSWKTFLLWGNETHHLNFIIIQLQVLFST